ncbi:hypothetical protein [Massilia sp. TS11]|uniref:hypothetical protein n=1 Tax=Massilia sp. TS11 TaxID=2908003 RepID=UPI001EDAA0CE|nr:hypothetical protein [Massilia sp. TS11]MCG2583604.1 hypothetical protein [Massilia sp. TS11]
MRSLPIRELLMMVECNRTLEQARRDLAQGLLRSAALLRVPMQRQAWHVHLAGARGDAGLLLDVSTLQPQVFRSLDQAVAVLEQIGFRCDQLRVA